MEAALIVEQLIIIITVINLVIRLQDSLLLICQALLENPGIAQSAEFI